jgi:hypothetical protein
MFGIGKHNRAGSGDNTLSVAKISGLFVVGAALITTIPTSISLLSHDANPPLTTAVAAPTTTSLSNGAPDTALRFSPLTNGKLTVSGSAQKDVAGMYVMIGPKPLGDYDTGCGNVADGRWQAEVSTDASWPEYPMVTSLLTVRALVPQARVRSTSLSREAKRQRRPCPGPDFGLHETKRPQLP